MTTLPATMKAWQLHAYNEDPAAAINSMECKDIALPTVTDTSILIKVSYASVNPIDWKLFTGGFHGTAPIATFPYTPGFDVAGEVVQVGANATGKFAVGDTVISDIGLVESCTDPAPKNGPAGAFAEYAVVETATAVKISGNAEKYVGLPLAGLTAYQALFTGQAKSFEGKPLGCVKSGSKVLVLGGAGGVGSLAIQLAAAKGCSVTTTASTSKMPDGSTKIVFCKSMGADTVIDYTTEDWSEKLAGQNFDLIFDCVGKQEDYDVNAPKVLKPDGLFVSIANFNGNESKNNIRFAVFLLLSAAADLQELVDLVASGKVKIPIDSTHKFSDVKEALTRSLGGKSVGKVLIKM